MTMAMSKDQQVETEVHEISPLGNKALIGESRIGKAPMVLVPECLLLLLCFYTFATAIFL